MATLETIIQARLEATTALTNAVSTRIYRYQRPRASALPAVTFQRINTHISNYSTGALTTKNATFQVDAWAADMDTCRTVADAVTTALSGWSSTGTTPAFKMVHQVSDYDLSTPPTDGDDVMMYRISQDYLLWFA
ncbi:MAG TPA: DUF3168 domain-containing protein [Thermoguttaceae bacterium]|nr:DUF3168 domain-containing protein [Thermoguttaceae bacterium]